MILHDKLNMDDSLINGYCIATDSAGKVLFKKHNMVVGAGRNAVFKLMANIIDDTEAFKNFSSIKFGIGVDITTIGTTDLKLIDDGKSYSYTVVTTESDENNEINNKAYLGIDDSNRAFKFTMHVDATTPAELTEMGLYFKNSAEVEKLFSRVIFDPIFCGPNAAVSSFDITYYVYL